MLARAARHVAVALLFVAAICPVAAQSFYAGRTVTLIAGFSVGGGFDLYSRVLARHMGRHLGGASVVVQNMPGAGGMTAANHIAGLAAKDGSVLGIVNPGLMLEPVLGNKAAAFKPTELGWIGAMNAEVSTCQIWHTAPAKRFEDVFRTELVVGGTGTGADSNLFPTVLNAALGTRLKLVGGYPGTTEIYLAMERGEVHGICGTYWSSVETGKAQWLAEKKMIPLVQLALDKHPRHPTVPLVMDFAKGEAARQTLEVLFSTMKFARSFWAPPGVPAERLAELRFAFERAMADPALIEDAAKGKLELGLVKGEEIERLVRRVYASPPEVVARIKAARDGGK